MPNTLDSCNIATYVKYKYTARQNSGEFFEGGIATCLIFKEGKKGWGEDRSNIHQIPPVFFSIQANTYMYYNYFP